MNFLVKKYLRRRKGRVIKGLDALIKQYLQFKEKFPEKGEKEIWKELINWLPTSNNNKEILLNIVDDNKEKNNLQTIFYWIYIFSTPLKECDSKTTSEFMKIIGEEFERFGLNNN